jgi:hypothetical protein
VEVRDDALDGHARTIAGAASSTVTGVEAGGAANSVRTSRPRNAVVRTSGVMKNRTTSTDPPLVS